MNFPKTIALIGSTGKSGQYLRDSLLKMDVSLKLLLRNPNSLDLQAKQAEVIQGDVRDPLAVEQLIQGCQAVISTLGQPKGESKPVFSEATQNILNAMHTHRVPRYIVTTGLQVDTPKDRKSPQVHAATEWMKANYTVTTLDKQKEYTLLTQCQIQWTLVRLPMIQLIGTKSPYSSNLEDCPGDQIAAANLADFLIQQLTTTEYVGEAPFLANQTT